MTITTNPNNTPSQAAADTALQERQISLWAFSRTNHDSQKKRWDSVDLHNFTFLVRPVNNLMQESLSKYPIGAKVKGFTFDDTRYVGTMMFSDKAGVVVLPLTLSVVREYFIPDSKLSEKNIQKVARQIEKDDPGSVFLGQITGHEDGIKEAVSRYFFNRTLEDWSTEEGDEEDRYKPYYREAQSILHPIHPEPRRDESTPVDYFTREKFWTLVLYFEPYQWCRRVNCPYCSFSSNKTFWGQIKEEYRQAAISRLERMKKLATLMMANTMLLTMPSSDDDDYFDSSSSLEADISAFKGVPQTRLDD